jgi:ubiquinone/menaquinone biosynthesis C-methylase UbiE
MANISDYAGYDYKAEFWGDGQRDYEHQVESHLVRSLISSFDNHSSSILDAGCGFGRMFPSYYEKGSEFYLVDYAQHLLDQAKKALHSDYPIHFLQGDIRSLPLKDNAVDLVVSIRTLHHIDTPADFFKDVHRVLRPDGTFIFEIPNKRHILNIARYLLGKLPYSPFSSDRVELSESFYNFHPKYVLKDLRRCGFSISTRKCESFFRIGIVKRLIPLSLLLGLERVFQGLFSWTFLTPSIVVKAKKS